MSFSGHHDVPELPQSLSSSTQSKLLRFDDNINLRQDIQSRKTSDDYSPYPLRSEKSNSFTSNYSHYPGAENCCENLAIPHNSTYFSEKSSKVYRMGSPFSRVPTNNSSSRFNSTPSTSPSSSRTSSPTSPIPSSLIHSPICAKSSPITSSDLDILFHTNCYCADETENQTLSFQKCWLSSPSTPVSIRSLGKPSQSYSPLSTELISSDQLYGSDDSNNNNSKSKSNLNSKRKREEEINFSPLREKKICESSELLSWKPQSIPTKSLILTSLIEGEEKQKQSQMNKINMKEEKEDDQFIDGDEDEEEKEEEEEEEEEFDIDGPYGMYALAEQFLYSTRQLSNLKLIQFQNEKYNNYYHNNNNNDDDDISFSALEAASILNSFSKDVSPFKVTKKNSKKLVTSPKKTFAHKR